MLLAILLGAGFALDSDEPAKPAPKAAPATPITTLERRVEQIRQLRFETLPKPQEVSPATAKREGLEDLDRSYPAAQRHADEEVLKLLGLLEPDVDLRDVSATIFGQGVAGYYDPRTKRMRIVRGAQTENQVLNEITISHELTHALEDQRFKLDLEDTSGSDDAALANLALVEGSATAVMFTYAERHFSAEQTLGGLFSSLGADTGDLPPFIEAQLIFPYVRGPAVRPAALRDRRRELVAGQLRLPLPPAGLERADHAPRQVPAGRAARAGAGREAPRARAGAGSPPARGASGPPASSQQPAGRRGLGRRPLRAVAARERRLPGARAATATRWSCAGAGTRAPTAKRFEAALREWPNEQTGSRAISSRGREVALALAPEADLAQRLVE